MSTLKNGRPTHPVSTNGAAHSGAHDGYIDVREQFEAYPYPSTPVVPRDQDRAGLRYAHCAIAPLYRKDGTVRRDPLRILDFGCGTGSKTMVLARANPGSHVVGVDFSNASIAVARARAVAERVDNVELHVLPLEKLGELGREFDYVNCDDTLYLLDDPLFGLEAMKGVLARGGVIRANVHNEAQRQSYLRAKQALQLLGIARGSSSEALVGTRKLFQSLHDRVYIKQHTWSRRYDSDDRSILSNHLLAGDKAFSLVDVLELVRAAGLEFVDMFDHIAWNVATVVDGSKPSAQETLAQLVALPRVDQLRFLELVHYRGRLLDFLCCHPGEVHSQRPFAEWTATRQASAFVMLHPALALDAVRGEAVRRLRDGWSWNVQPHVPHFRSPVHLPHNVLELVVLLGQERLRVEELVDLWVTAHPLDLATRRATSRGQASTEVRAMVARLVEGGLAFVECDDAAKT